MSKQSPRPTIGLAMIVRNEAAIIERCLGSVRPLIDTWTIIDTGSTDDTIAAITGALEGIPGQVISKPWRDFSSNRNELLELARPTADYLLLLDADMTVRICATDPLTELTAPAYDILVEAGIRYRMPYLISSAAECTYVGRTHEYLSFASSEASPVTPVALDDIVLTHLGDGGSKSDKFQRDLALLEDDARSDPNNARTMFYLAQTRENLGDGPGAIAAYRRRIELGGWEEEIFWSMYKSACILESRGDWPSAAQMFITAWEFRPTRLEPILHLARGYRESGAFSTALMWAERGKSLTYPEGERLFVERWVYDWGFDLELAVCAWWNGQRTFAEAMWTTLLARNDLTDSARAVIEANLLLPS